MGSENKRTLSWGRGERSTIYASWRNLTLLGRAEKVWGRFKDSAGMAFDGRSDLFFCPGPVGWHT